jgi:hypothetical protein
MIMTTIKHLTPEAAVVAAIAYAKSVGSVEFEGQNCGEVDEDTVCDGWDGEDRRCDCGNRRVYWATYGDDQMGYTAFATAD